MNFFSFFTRKKERSVPTFFQQQFGSEEYEIVQQDLINFFENVLKHKVEKIRNGIIYLVEPLTDTQEDKFAVAMFLEIEMTDEYSTHDYWNDLLNGFDNKKMMNWKEASPLVSTCVIQRPMLQKKSIVHQWHTNDETEVYVLKLPNRLVQIPEDWLKIWGVTSIDLKNRVTNRRETFIKRNVDSDERVGQSTPRRRNKPTDNSTDFDLKMTLNPKLRDKKSGMVNDACPLPEDSSDYTERIRFTGGEQIT